MAYEIHKTKEAEYHLLQFHGSAELLAQLDRTLRITDGVTRFRIIKLAPGTPRSAGPPRGDRRESSRARRAAAS